MCSFTSSKETNKSGREIINTVITVIPIAMEMKAKYRIFEKLLSTLLKDFN